MTDMMFGYDPDDPNLPNLPDRQQELAYTWCPVCGGEIYAGERCWLINERLYHLDCVTEVIAGEGD